MRKLLIFVFVSCAIVLVTLLLADAPLGAWIVAAVAWFHHLGLRGGVLYALIYVAATVTLVPQTPFNLAAGFLYGALWGSMLVSIASTIAATIGFLLARYCARDFVARKFGKYARFESMDQAIEKNGFKLVLLMRLQPVFVPFAYLNIGLGLTRVRVTDYMLGTLLGTLPGTILYAYVGSAVQDISFFAFHALPSENIAPRWFFWMGLLAVTALCILLAHIARQSFATALKPQAEVAEEAA